MIMEAETHQEDGPRLYRTQAPPTCPTHEVLMIGNGTTERIRYFICPVPGCTCTDKQIIRDKQI